jgi:hypothetical protein
MSDHEATAKRLLPCDGAKCVGENHWPFCPANFRPAVAAALAARDVKLEVERQSIIVLSDMVVDKEAEIEHWKLNCLSKDDELAQLRAERDSIQAEIDNETSRTKAKK